MEYLKFEKQWTDHREKMFDRDEVEVSTADNFSVTMKKLKMRGM